MKAETGAGALRRRVLRGVGGQAFGQIVGLAAQIASVPLFLAFWGIDLYGEWLIVATIPAYLTTSDLGFTTATLHAMTTQVAAGDRAGALRSFRTSWWVVSLISLVVCGLVSAGAHFVPIADWLRLGRIDDGELALLLTLYGVYVVLSLQTGLLNAGFFAEGEYGQGLLLLGLARLTEFALLALVVSTGYGPVGVVVAFLAGRTAIAVAMRWRLRTVAPWLTLGLRGFDCATARKLFGPAMGFTGYTIAGALNVQGPVLVIGALFGPVAVVPFATLRMLTRIVPQLLQGLSNIVRPEIGIAFGRDDMVTTRRLNRLACRLALWAIVAAAAGLAACGGFVVELWTGGKVAVEQPLFALLLAVAAVNTLWNAGAWSLQAINRVQGQAVVYLLVNIAALLAMTALGTPAGLAGMVAVLLLGDCVMAGYVFHRTLAFLDERPGPFAASLLTPPVDIIRQLRGR